MPLTEYGFYEESIARGITDTPHMDSLIKLTSGFFTRHELLLAEVVPMLSERGVYINEVLREGNTSNLKTHTTLLIHCRKYQSIRCPFRLNYFK